MKVTITYDLKSCEGCPYKQHYYEQGFCGDFCNHPKCEGILKCDDKRFPCDCPFLKQEEEDDAAIAMRESLGENWW